MEKLRELDMHYQKVHQERLKIERKIKMQEAQDIQNNVLHGKTLENELKIIERQKDSAKARNEKILSDALNKMNNLNEKISQNALKRSSDRLKNAKSQYFEVVTAGFPDWLDALKDPELFQARKMQENLEKLKKIQSVRDMEHKKHLESQMEIVKTELFAEFRKTSEQLRTGLAEEQDLMKLRERSRKEFEAKIEEERQNLRSQLQQMRSEEMARQEELLREAQREVLGEGARISTPNAHIPNVFHLKRPDESLHGNYVPGKYEVNSKEVQKFSIERPSSVGVRSETKSPIKNPELSMSKMNVQVLPTKKKEVERLDERGDYEINYKKSEFREPKPTKIEHSQPKSKYAEPVVEYQPKAKKIENNEFKHEYVEPKSKKNENAVPKYEYVEPKPEYRETKGKNVEVIQNNEYKGKKVSQPDYNAPKPQREEYAEPKIVKAEFSDSRSTKIEAKISKPSFTDSNPPIIEVKSKSTVSSLPIETKITSHQAIKKIIEANDEDTPSSLRAPTHLNISTTPKIPEQPEPSNSDSNEFDYDKIDLPDNSSIPKASKPSTGTIKSNPVQIIDDDFDSGIQIIRGPQPKFPERKSEETSSKGKQVPAKLDLKVETKTQKNLKALEIDDEFEIKTVKSKKNLKAPDIEESLEDSSQLDSEYFQGFVKRETESKASSKVESRPATSKASVKNEEIGLRKDSSSKIIEPMSPSAVSSTTGFFEIRMIAQNKVLNSILVQQRKIAMQALFDLLRDNLTRSGSRLVNFNEELTMQRLEKLYENYLMNKLSFKYKSNEELLGFILTLGRTLPDCFLPSELARSKHPFSEMMIREKMKNEHFLIYGLIKEFLVESIGKTWIKEGMAVDMFVDTLVNFSTSKSQYSRCKGCLGKVLKAEMSRPPTSNKDASIEIMRVVTPNDRNLGSRLVAKSGGYGTGASEIEAFKEIIDDY